MISLLFSVHVLHCIGHFIFDVVSIISFVDISILSVGIYILFSFFGSSCLSSILSEIDIISSILESDSFVILLI